MTVWPGDKIGEFTVERLVAYQGKTDCTYMGCTRRGCRERADGTWDLGVCMGWHCALCDAPCSSMGHDCPRKGDVAA